MNVDATEYYTPEEWDRFKNCADKIETPFLLVNVDIVEKNYNELKTYFPYAKTFFAVKANPGKEILSRLIQLGSHFDIASIYELDKVLELGASPDKLSYGNTIKKPNHIKYAYEKGIRLYATDSEIDLRNIAKTAPGSKIFCRILTEGAETADWPLSRKFGCQPEMAIDLLILAKKLGLIPHGISFHVGSQQRDIGTWDSAIAKAKYIFDWMAENENVKLQMINMGGGLPAPYMSKTNDLQIYADEITRYLHDDFGDELPEIILEPGRSMVGNCGILVSEIVLISRKSRTALDRWIYLDVGKFNGLIETLDECIKYPIYCDKKGINEDAIIAGPTCDSQDVMYERNQYSLPLSLAVGDRLYWLTTGAYTSSYCSVEFNGFPPLKTYYV